jgi:acylpyruvate hydrolase
MHCPRIFCIGRNYVAHAEELKNPLPTAPVVFMKHASMLIGVGEMIILQPQFGQTHFEGEWVWQVGREGQPPSENDPAEWISGHTLGLDLTRRELQSELKRMGLPWERAKCFAGSAPLGELKPIKSEQLTNAFRFELLINGQVRQRGDSRDLIFPMQKVLFALGELLPLQTGDLIFSGTPAGVGPLEAGDDIELVGDDLGPFHWPVSEAIITT